MFKMFSCKDISKVTCHHDDLCTFEKMNYRIHLFLCAKCRKYAHSIEGVASKFSDILNKRREVSPEKITHLENRVLDSIKKKNESE